MNETHLFHYVGLKSEQFSKEIARATNPTRAHTRRPIGSNLSSYSALFIKRVLAASYSFQFDTLTSYIRSKCTRCPSAIPLSAPRPASWCSRLHPSPLFSAHRQPLQAGRACVAWDPWLTPFIWKASRLPMGGEWREERRGRVSKGTWWHWRTVTSWATVLALSHNKSDVEAICRIEKQRDQWGLSYLHSDPWL